MTRQQPQSSSRSGWLRSERLGRSGVHLLTLAMVLISLWMLAGFVSQVIASAQLERRRDALSSEVASIQATNVAIQRTVEFAESPAYAEQVARDQLGYAREGDIVIFPTIPEATPPADTSATPPLPAPAPQPNWYRWLQVLAAS
ncbi:MAG TPA: septum formation initiator family protein [Roseiflexaceae bacterium]|nr:septum formation initiator family protein [Roseiflexaceae bacterium]HMP40370.1 septum formation initiator family protein [Roseiflexaceae bacterium]